MQYVDIVEKIDNKNKDAYFYAHSTNRSANNKASLVKNNKSETLYIISMRG